MNALHALQIVNDLTLTLVGENEVDGLTRGVLQRLLYHTGFAAGMLVERTDRLPGPELVLVQAIGNRELARQVGAQAPWLESLVDGPSAVIAGVELPEGVFAGAARYRHGLRLTATPDGALVILLLGPTAPKHGLDIAALFEPLLPRFVVVYRHCRDRGADLDRLNAEIEQRRRAEASLRASEARSRALFEGSPQPIALLDLAARRPLLLNARLRDVLGWNASELAEPGAWWHKLFPEASERRATRTALREGAKAALSGSGIIEPLRAKVRCRDGADRWFEVHAKIVGEQAIVSLVDLTSQNDHEQELRAAKETAERASAAKSQFLSNVSHELRTPLNAILGYAQLLDNDERLSELQRAHAREILESGYHLLALVDDVLDLTRIESGRMVMSIGAVPLDDVLRESVALVEAQAMRAGVTIERRGLVGVMLACDATRLRQVLINLLSNAIKYNVPDGRVIVDAELVASGGAAPLTGSDGPGARLCRVRVHDTGVGIPPERQRELFQPFNRLGAEGGHIEGTGIGLAVARQLLELMGGHIGVESQAGAGSTFWFELPAASGQMPGSATRPALRVPSPRTIQRERTGDATPKKPRILVVEDHPMNQRLICLQLGEIGAFDVAVAHHGAQALERWQQGDIDLVLTDCNMPIMDGYELTAVVRESEAGTASHVPIIAVSASAMKEDVDRCLAAGMDACLSKPLMVGTLAEALDRWLPRPDASTTEALLVAPRSAAMARPADRRQPYRRALEKMLPAGAAEEVDGLLVDFLRSGLATVEQGRRGVDAGDIAEVGRAAHKLRPAAKLVGAYVMAAHAQVIEAAARAGDAPVVAELWALLESAWERVRIDMTPPPPPTRQVPLPSPTRVSGSDAVRPRDRTGLRGLRTLVIDDDAFTAKYVSEQLTRMGVARVQVAEDGRRGLERVRESGAEIDLVICDLAMPGMDGVELLRHLGQHEFRGSLVFMSGAGSRVLGSVDELARQHGFHVLGTLAKPFGAQALADLLAQHRPAMARRSRDTRMLQVGADELAHAIAAGHITVHLQPKVLTTTLEVVGFEALARWIRADGDMVPPTTFVRIAETHGLADALFDSVFRSALSAGKRLAAAGFPLKVAVNVSAMSLTRVEIAESILAGASQLGCDPKNLILEVTETGLVRDLRIALDVLTRLRLHDIGLSIDDFGTGYSSIDLLRRVPFTELKIDRSFVSSCLRDPSARHIIASSLAMARGLGLQTVAEGVENERELEVMRELGCDLIQGYFIAKPMTESALLTWLQARSA